MNLELPEYGHITAILTPAELATLQRLPAGVLAITPTAQTAQYHLQANSRVGLIGLPSGRTLAIHPRIAIADWFALLAAEYQPRRVPVWSMPAHAATLSGAIAALAELFANALAAALRSGPLRRFATTRQQGNLLRGRLAMTETVRLQAHHPTAHVFESVHLSTDTPENQLLRRAVGLALTTPELPLPVVGQLHTHLCTLGGPLPAHLPLNSLPPATRASAHYGLALFLARLLVSHTSLSGAAGQTPAFSFLVDMAWLFERRVLCAVRAGLPSPYLLAEQARFPLDVARQLTVRPDGVLYHHAQAQLVIDAKYKMQREEADVYQMVAYCRALGVQQAVLIYPQLAKPETLTLPGQPPLTLHCVSLPLNSSPTEQLASSRALQTELLGWVGGYSTPYIAVCG